MAILGGGATHAPDRQNIANNAINVNPGGFINFAGDEFDSYTTGANATFSYSFWIKLDAFDNAYRCIMAKASFESLCQIPGRQYAILVTPTGKLQLQAFGSLTGGHARVDGNTTLTVGEWHHIAISVDMATLLASLPATTGLTMYVDGVLQTNTVSEISGNGILPSGIQDGPAHLGFGTYLNTAGAICAGTQNIDAHFDDFRIYDRVITAQEVGQLFNEGNAPCDPAVIVQQPLSDGACTGTVTLLCQAQSGTVSEMRWEWFNGTTWQDMGISTTNNITSVGVDNSLNGMWRVKLTSDCGTVSYSDVATVLIGPAPTPTITQQPQDAFICNSPEDISIAIDPTGATYRFYWERFNGLDWVGTGFQSIGTDGSTISVFNDLTGQIRVRIEEQNCSTTLGYSDEFTVDNMSAQDLSLNFDYVNGVVEAASGFDTYNWYYQGTYINGVTGNSYSPTQNGDHELWVYLNGCLRTITFNWTGTVTGIVDGVASVLKVYPNPFEDIVAVDFDGTTQVRLLNTLGEMVLSQTISGRATLDVSSLPSGIYFLQHETSGDVMKLVKN